MEKGRLRTPGLLAWASGRAAEDDFDVAAPRQVWQTTQKTALRHSAACHRQFFPVFHPCENWGLPFIFWEAIPVLSELWVPIFQEPLLGAKALTSG